LDIVSDKALANVFCIKAILRLATKNCFCESSQRLIQPRLVRWAQAIKEIIAEGLADITAGRVKEFDPAAIIARGKKRLSDK
jgi:hypothetical protein